MRPGWQGPAKGEGMARQRHTELPNSRKWRPKGNPFDTTSFINNPKFELCNEK